MSKLKNPNHIKLYITNMQKIINLIVFMFVGLTLSAQTTDKTADYSRPKKFVISDIKISGIKYLDTDILLHIAEFRVGDEIDIPGDKFTSTIKKYWKQGLFSDVQISYTPIKGNEVSIDIYLQEQPRLSRVVFHGLRSGQEKDIRGKLHLRTGNQVTEDIVKNSERIIKDHFKEKGFYFCDVKSIVKNDTTYKNTVKLIFNVDRGKRTRIKDIEIVGNVNIKDRKVRRWIKNTKKVDWNIFKASKYYEPNYKEDKKVLIEKYTEKGFRDATIVSDSLYVIEKHKFSLGNVFRKMFGKPVKPKIKRKLGIKINIAEGNKYYFRDIRWVGNTKFPSEYLSTILNIKKGDHYDKTLLNNRLNVDEDAVTTLYMDRGYLFFNVQPVEVKVDKDSIDIELRIFEGEQATINKVIIEGNTKTNEHVIRREIRTKPGELFSRSKIMRTQRELATLGHFDPEKLGVDFKPHQENNTVDLTYMLEEKANDQLEISGGWGGGMFVGSLGVRFTNFSARKLFKFKEWNSIVPTGDGQTLSLRGQTNGKYYKSFNISFVEPWLGGKKPNSFHVSFYYSSYSKYNWYSQSQTDDPGQFDVIGASVGLGKRLEWPDNYFTLMHTVGYKRYFLDNYDMGFGFKTGNSNILTYNLVFGRNSVSQPLYPRNGSDFSLSIELTPPFSLFKSSKWWELSDSEAATIMNGSGTESEKKSKIEDAQNKEKYKWVEYHKWDFKGSWYKSLIGDLVLSAHVRMGYLGYYNKDLGYSPFEKYQLGGDGMSGYNMYGVQNIGLRGYENNSLTAEERYLDPISGAIATRRSAVIYDKFSLDLRYPLALKPQATVYGMVFVEAGNSWSKFKDFNPFDAKRSAGVGVRIFLPMLGMLGVDWGYGFDKVLNSNGVDVKAGGSQFHFVIGQQF